MKREFKERYLFTGTLVLKTGLHIGGGEASFSPSDSPVIRTADGKPFIPGSSFKGAFRSTVEKLAPMIPGFWSCGLDSEIVYRDPEGKERYCIGPQGKAQTDFNTKERDPNWPDRVLLEKLEERLCHTCKLFGSPYMASQITFADLYTAEESEGLIQIRNGVAIDRDSEQAVDGLLYDYEVVSPTLTFDLNIWLEDPTETDLGLTCLGLSEFLSGFGFLGGKRSRGLGQCQLTKFKIYHVDLSDPEKLLKYLRGREAQDKMEYESESENFFNKHIQNLIGNHNHA